MTITSRYVHQEIYFSRHRSRLHKSERRMAEFARQWYDKQTARLCSAERRNYHLADHPALCPWQQSRLDPRTTDRFETCQCRGQDHTGRWRLEYDWVCKTQSAALCSVSTAQHQIKRPLTNISPTAIAQQGKCKRTQHIQLLQVAINISVILNYRMTLYAMQQPRNKWKY